MDLLLDIQYARMLMPRLTLAKVTQNRPFKMNMRCPVCGDSRKNKFAARGWIYEGTTGKTRGVLLFDCFNCNNDGRGAIGFQLFLKENYRSLYDQYRMEKFKNEPKREPKEQQPAPELPVPAKPEAEVQRYNYQIIPDLEDGHPVKRYIQNRCIPEDKQHLLGFTLNWKSLCNQIRPDSFSEKSLYFEQPRLVIPIFDKTGLIGVQGRALRKQDQPRYQTIKVDDQYTKLYGTERVNESKPVVFVEGPIDSLFVDNGVAIAGGFMALEITPYQGNRIWALDNEPRAKDTLQRQMKLIGAGERVTIWDRLPEYLACYKDINDMIQKGGATVEFINEYIHANTVSGLQAKLRFDAWRKNFARS